MVEKFEFLCTSDDVDEDYYVNILANKRLYIEFRYCKDRLPRLRRLMKSEPDSHWLDDYDEMVANVEKYNNLETFEFEWDF